MAFTPRVLSLTYTCPTTPDAAEAAPAGSSAQADVRTSGEPSTRCLHFHLRCMRGMIDLHAVSVFTVRGNGVAVVNPQAVMPRRAWRCSF
jgi:hypothetical protein